MDTATVTPLPQWVERLDPLTARTDSPVIDLRSRSIRPIATPNPMHHRGVDRLPAG